MYNIRAGGRWRLALGQWSPHCLIFSRPSVHFGTTAECWPLGTCIQRPACAILTLGHGREGIYICPKHNKSERTEKFSHFHFPRKIMMLFFFSCSSFLLFLEAPYTQCNGIETAGLIASGLHAFRIQIKHWAPSSDNNMDTFKSSIACIYFAFNYFNLLTFTVILFYTLESSMEPEILSSRSARTICRDLVHFFLLF